MNQRDERRPGSMERDRAARDVPLSESEPGTSDELIGSRTGAGTGVGVAPSPQDVEPSGYGAGDSGPGPRLMTASTLEGDDVVNAAGEDLGKIEEIMLDVPHGRVAYAVLSFGGFLGIGSKLFALPWQALKLDPPNHRFVLDIPRDRLEAAPGFDKDRWPDWADMTWAASIHKYYGTKPYWE